MDRKRQQELANNRLKQEAAARAAASQQESGARVIQVCVADYNKSAHELLYNY